MLSYFKCFKNDIFFFYNIQNCQLKLKGKIQVIINEYHQILQSKLSKGEQFNLSLKLKLKSTVLRNFYKK